MDALYTMLSSCLISFVNQHKPIQLKRKMKNPNSEYEWQEEDEKIRSFK